MKIEKYHDEIRYTLSNENLQVGDKVFPITRGRCTEDGGWILHGFDFLDFMSGFPDKPHTIINLKHSDYKPEEVRTDYGYSPIECYFKIIKREKQVVTKKETTHLAFKETKWIEI